MTEALVDTDILRARPSMRKNEDHIFDAKRTQEKISETFDRFFAQTLGVSLEPVCALRDALLNDLSSERALHVPLGWEPPR